MKYQGSFYLLVLIFSITLFTVAHGQKTNPCKKAGYQASTLKLLKEQTIAESFVDSSIYIEAETVPNRFEASDVVLSRDGQVMYVVFDNTYRIGAMCTPFGRSLNCTDQLLDWPDPALKKKNSGFEGMAYNPLTGTYFVVQEAIGTATKNIFNANVFEIRINPKDSVPVQVIESCLVNWEFGSANKGLEGLEFVVHKGTGQSYLLGLCEANKCDHKSTSKNDGRIMVLEKKVANTKKTCSWQPVGTFDLPSSVHFSDYSAISIYDQESPRALPTYVAVTSQENSQVWIGVIKEINQAPFFELSSLEKNTIYDLPRSTEVANDCHIRYCNIEGVAWRGKNQLILVSDKAKSDQDINCIEKDQSAHYFVLPEHLTD